MTNKELQQQIEQLEQQIKDLKVKLEEECFLPYVPYEVEVPTDIEEYYILEEGGDVLKANTYSEKWRRNAFIRGLVFETREEAEQFKKEQILLFKLHKWAEEHNGDWTPNWEDIKEEKWSVMYDDKNKELETYVNYKKQDFLKLPYFKTQELAEQFIEEFDEEIKEVLL